MAPRRFAVLLAVLGLFLVSCGSDDDDGGGGSSEPSALAVEITESGKTSTVKVPRSVEAGLVEVSLENSGEAPHSVQLVRVDGDQTAAQVEEVTGGQGGIPDWLPRCRRPRHDPPGAVEHGHGGARARQLLRAGRRGRGGGITKFEVTGEAAEAELPSTDATITASVTFDNAGEELHHAIAAPINDGKTIADVKEFFMTEGGPPSGPPPVDFEGGFGTAVLDGGAKEVADLELKAGRYAFVCFIPDRAGGPPHIAKGMLQEIEIPG
jgi:hypothetical protein